MGCHGGYPAWPRLNEMNHGGNATVDPRLNAVYIMRLYRVYAVSMRVLCVVYAGSMLEIAGQ